MKSFIIFLALTLLCSAKGNSPFQIDENEKIIFLGDSITRMGTKPKGYISLVNQAVQQTRSNDNIQVIGKGIGGNKVPDLLKRLERDVLDHRPTMVMVYIGINDIWHWTRPHPVTKEPREGTTVEAYEAGLRDIVQQLQQQKIKVLLCTPTVIGENSNSAENSRLDQYSNIVRKIAADTNSDLLDLRKIFVDYLRKNNPQNQRSNILTSDSVHMNDQGNALLAKSFLSKFGMKLPQPSTTTAPPNEDLAVYLLIGQSNMAGRAPIPSELAGDLENVFLLNDAGEWAPARNPLNQYSTIGKPLHIQKLGPGYSFAQSMVKANPMQQIGLIVNARGGSKIESWQKKQEYYQQTLDRVRQAQKLGSLKGVLWHQGESNHEDPEYLPKLIQFINDLKADLSMPELPFIVGQINNVALINNQLNQLPQKVKHTACVSSEGLTTSDKWHYDTKSQLMLGERFAKAMLELQE
ncbi:sialate O-acetylesterase [Rubritalea spongiae]|uniref:Sialate O-acetylesterase n=1 Tax=Rubritalea spongiae TaxID=430797 RepID=A0ABW5E091_9BACT